MAAVKPFIINQKHDMIGLVVAEPIGQLIACYLRRDPRVHLEDHVATGGFDAITVSAEALNHGDSP
jgi:probable phosphoglycerate mutase